MGLKREHRESLSNLAGKQEISLFTLRGEYAAKLTEYENKISSLEAQVIKYQQEVERCKTIASIQVIKFQCDTFVGRLVKLILRIMISCISAVINKSSVC